MLPLAAILGSCLLVLCPSTHSVPWAIQTAALQSPPSSPEQPAGASRQNSTARPESAQTDQQGNHDQSASPQQTQVPSATPCPEKAVPDSAAKADCQPATSVTSKTRKQNRAQKAAAPSGSTPTGSTPTGSTPTKTVVRNGSTSDPTVEISPSRSQQQNSQALQNTNRLLATSDANLKKLSGRQLSSSQRDTVNQIKSYMEQAKKAANAGDVQRAYNLAFKANLLSADLAGH